MPDWKSEASRKLEDTRFPSAEREEISRELGGYLEDLCNEARGRGSDESDAVQRALDELHQDARLGVNLRRARKEKTMNDRTKQFWLPAFVVLSGSVLAEALFQIAGFSPYFPRAWAGNASSEAFLHHSLTIYFPWLCVLPFLAAAGAYWSRRAGGGATQRLVAGLFPALVFLFTFSIIFPVSFATGSLPPMKIFLPALAANILSWVVIPGAALLLGVVPFLRDITPGRHPVASS